MSNQNFQFTGAVEALYPPADDRPFNRGTFMFQGISITWDDAPRTTEDVRVLIVVPEFGEHEFLVRDLDPSENSLEDWFHCIAGGPVAIPSDEQVKVTYRNTDGTTVTVKIIGYFTNG